jgi:hypothetical protein
MVQLLAVKASIAALKRALSLSKRFKPSTWELLAIFSATLFVLSVWGFGDSQQQHIKPGVSTVTPEIGRHSLEGESSVSPFTASLEDSNHSPGSIVTISDYDSSDTHPAVILSAGDDTLLYVSSAQERSRSRQASISKPWVLSHRHNCNAFVWGGMDSPAATKFDLSGYVAMYAHLRAVNNKENDLLASIGLNSGVSKLQMAAAFTPIANDGSRVVAGEVNLVPSTSLSDFPNLGRFFREAPTVIYQSAPEAGSSLRKGVMFWAPLFGLIVSPLVGVGMLLLAWIGLHRKRAEEALLYLQLQKCQLEIDKLKKELETARHIPRVKAT